MGEQTIYKSMEGKQKIQVHYEAYLNSFPIPIEREYVETSYGTTHVLIAGPRNGKPIVVLHGGNCINPMTLSWFIKLADTYRIYAPDMIGHPGFSDQRKISAKDDSFPNWIAELMAHFQLSKCPFIGASYGGGVILRLATFKPELIEAAVLVCPAGIQLGSKLAMIRKILIPMLSFTTFGSRKSLTQLTDEMSTGHMKEIDREIIGDIFRYVKLEQEMPKLTTKVELGDYHSPTMIVGGAEDVFFPSKGLKVKVASNFNHPTTVFHEYEMGHFPSDVVLEHMNAEINKFLTSIDSGITIEK